MARNQRKYDTEYKVQAVKLFKEIGSAKASEAKLKGLGQSYIVAKTPVR